MFRFFIGLLCLALLGCQTGWQGPQRPTFLGPQAHIACQRAWLSQAQLTRGLHVVFTQIEDETGPLYRHQLVTQMVGHMQQCLYNAGRCSWENIDLNGRNYVICACFRPDLGDGTLEIKAYCRGDHANTIVARCAFVTSDRRESSPQPPVQFTQHTRRGPI